MAVVWRKKKKVCIFYSCELLAPLTLNWSWRRALSSWLMTWMLSLCLTHTHTLTHTYCGCVAKSITLDQIHHRHFQVCGVHLKIVVSLALVPHGISHTANVPLLTCMNINKRIHTTHWNICQQPFTCKYMLIVSCFFNATTICLPPLNPFSLLPRLFFLYALSHTYLHTAAPLSQEAWRKLIKMPTDAWATHAKTVQHPDFY